MIFTVTLNPAVDRENVVSKLVPNTVLRATKVHIDYGGKGFNVSRMLASLGVENTALGFVGGNAGSMLENGLSSLGIGTDFVRIEGETRTNTTIVELDGTDHFKVNEPGPFISKDEINALLSKIKVLIAPGDWWVLAGSLPPGVPKSFYTEIIELVQSGGAKAVLDTSGEALSIGIQAKPILIKPNIFEAHTLTGVPGKTANDIMKSINLIHAKGVSMVAISAGKDASFFSDGNKIWQAAPPHITEMNPVGAGDAMLAGILYGLSLGKENQDSFTWGIAAGSAAAGKAGTAMPSKIEVEALKNSVEIKEIENAL